MIKLEQGIPFKDGEQIKQLFTMKCVNLMTLLVQCVIAVTLLNIMLSFATIDDSNLIVFHHITLSECELKCAKRPSCIGIGYARTTSLCYLLHTEEELVDTGTKFQRNLVLVRKNNFKNAEALQVLLLFIFV